jgi:hypothetical protein
VWATLVEELGFLELHQRAATLFHGKCMARNEVRDGKPIPYTEYTFQVIRAVKGCRDSLGKAQEKIVVRHAGTRSGQIRPDGLEAAPLRLGLPEYEVGEEVVLFLTRESRLGLCAPVGLAQGRFSVVRDGGRRLVKNSMGNRGLLSRLGTASVRDMSEAELEALKAGEGRLEIERFLDLCERAGK